MSASNILRPGKATDSSRLLTLIGTVVTVAGLYLGRQVLIPLGLAIVFAFLLSPIVGKLEKYHFGRIAAVMSVVVIFLSMIAATGWMVTDQLMQIITELPNYKLNIHHKVESMRGSGGGLGRARASVEDISSELATASATATNKTIDKKSAKNPIAVQVTAPPRTVTEYLRALVGPLTGIVELIGIVVVFTLFILVKQEDLRNRVLRLAGIGQLNLMTQVMDDASKRLGRYLLLQFLVNSCYGVLFGLGIYALGVPHSLLWGILAGLLRFVPYIGTLAAATFPMLMAIAVFPGWSQVALIFALFLLLEITVANVVEPLLYGAHTGISSLALLVAAIFWGLLWGPVGLILSTPLTVCLVLMGRYIPQLNFLEILLGDEPVLSPPAHLYQRLLALDDDEARQIVDRYLKENSLESLYDSVVIPALSLAEQDRHMNMLDESRSTSLYQNLKELIEGELSDNPTPLIDNRSPGVSSLGLKIVCIPARDEADETIAIMAAQVLRRAGLEAYSIPLGFVSTMLQQVLDLNADVVCVSALPPHAAAQAKSLCKKLQQSIPTAPIILGLWEFPGGIVGAQERVGIGCANAIATSLNQLVSLTTNPDIVVSRALNTRVETAKS